MKPLIAVFLLLWLPLQVKCQIGDSFPRSYTLSELPPRGKILNFGYYPGEVIPDSVFPRLADLTILSIYEGDTLDSLPDFVFRLKKIKILITHVYIRHISLRIHQLSELSDLYILNGADGSTLCLEQFPKLKTLDLVECAMVVSVAEGSKLPNLEFLQMDHCQNIKLPHHFEAPKLDTIWIYDCAWDRLPGSLRKLSKLEDLILTGSLFSTLKINPGDFPALKTLTLNHGQLRRIDLGAMPAVTTISLDYNQFKCLDDLHSGLLPRLKRLSLYSNHIKEGHLSIWADSLYEIDLGVNSLTTLGSEMLKYKQLGALSIDGNQFQAVPEILFHCANLHWICLGNNPLGGTDFATRQLEAMGKKITWERIQD